MPSAAVVANEIEAGGIAAVARAVEITSRSTSLLEAAVKARIRKGATGRLERSVTRAFVAVGGVATGAVWSDDPSAHRFEFGFVGVDAEGRHYHQPAYPAFRPAADALTPGFLDAVEFGVAEIL